MMQLEEAYRISGTGALPASLVADWRAFLSQPRTLDDLFKHGCLFPLQRRRELEKMVGMAASLKPEVGLIVGSDKAGDVWSFLNGCPTLKTLIAIEIRGVPWTDEFRKAFPRVEFLTFADSSYAPETVRAIQDFLGDSQIDFAFLDGHKGHFVDDFDAYLPMVKKSGLIFLHDIVECHGGDPTVRAWAKIKGRGYATEEIIDFSEGVEEMKRPPAPPATAHAGWLRIFHNRSCGVGCVTVP